MVEKLVGKRAFQLGYDVVGKMDDAQVALWAALPVEMMDEKMEAQ